MGNASLALEELPSTGPTRSYINEVLSASERAALLIRQMLAYAGKGRFAVARLDLSQQVAEIVPLLRHSVPSNQRLDLQLASSLPPVEADPAQMQQVIMNLAINAAEAIGGSAGTVTIATFARETESEHQVVLEVRDSGSGMDETTRARIFDPFFSTKFTGRGLGLSAVMGIVRGHRGFISVESAPGAGSVFTIVLPAALAGEITAPLEMRMELRGYGHLLVVDDEELVRTMARFTLERCGYTVELASSGEAALKLFAGRSQDFDAVLLDLTMPGMNGEETLIRMRAINPGVRVILSSGFDESEVMRRFSESQLAGFLQKPYTAAVLARKVKQALRRDVNAPG
jgi:CheY-like chemotaxis protein